MDDLGWCWWVSNFKVTVRKYNICSHNNQQTKKNFLAPSFSTWSRAWSYTRGFIHGWTFAAVLHDLDYPLEYLGAIVRCRGCRSCRGSQWWWWCNIRCAGAGLGADIVHCRNLVTDVLFQFFFLGQLFVIGIMGRINRGRSIRRSIAIGIDDCICCTFFLKEWKKEEREGRGREREEQREREKKWKIKLWEKITKKKESKIC